AAPEVGPTFARARELCEKAGETSQAFEVMWGNWTWHLVRGELKLCMSLADEMMALAQEARDPGMIMEAYVAPAVTHFYRGDFTGCRKHCDQAIANYENQEQCAIWCGRLGQNSAVVLRCYLSLALWQLGFPEQAVSTNEQMLVLARQLAHPFSLAHGLHFTGWLHQYMRIPSTLREAAFEEITIGTSQGFALWHATGIFFNGAGVLLQGGLEEGLRLLEEGIHSFLTIAAVLTLPAQLAVLAEALTMVGRYEEAAQALDKGLALAQKNDDRSHEPELHRLMGALALARSDDQSTAEECFQRAIETARKQRSLAWELRSTVSLAKLLQQQNRRSEAVRSLTAVYGAYTEGFFTPDLLNAKDLLNSLG